MSIHHEGHKLILTTAIIGILLNVIVQYFFPYTNWLHVIVLGISLFFFLVFLQFFRKPDREPTLSDKQVIAPCDGKVVVIEEVVESEYFKEPRRQVSIFMSPINVHINWNPVAGLVKYFKYHPGKYLVAWHPKSSTENERTTTVIQTASGVEVLFRQIAGALAKRIVWYVGEGQTVSQCSEMGFIKFGSRVDIFLPLDAKINVKLNDVTTGSQTVIADLV